MTPEEVEQAISTARDNQSTDLSFAWERISILPDSIGDLINLTGLDLRGNELTHLPDSIGKITNLIWLNLSDNELTHLPNSIGNLTNLTTLNLNTNRLTSLPDSIGNITNLASLYLGGNHLTSLPNSIGDLTNLASLDLFDNRLTSLPESIGNLANLFWLCLILNRLTSLPNSIEDITNLASLDLSNNQLSSLPDSMRNLTNLIRLDLTGNPSIDLSILVSIPSLESVILFGVDLPRRYWTNFSEWKSEWLLDEDNAEVRRILIEQIGYEKICDELSAINLDTWREYTLLKIDGIEKIYDGEDEPIDTEPMVLLKMICPSTAHIHILRVPPEMVSAEEAITWVNHSIHPNEFVVQT
jgi:leucine-rich repeat protein SHOC2